MLVARIRHTGSNDEGTTAAKHLGPRATKTHHRGQVTTNGQAWRCTDGERKGKRLRRIWSQDSWYIKEKGASRPQHRCTVTRAVRERTSNSVCSTQPEFHRTASTASVDPSHCKPAVEPVKHFSHSSRSSDTDQQPPATHHRRFRGKWTRCTPRSFYKRSFHCRAAT